MCGALQLDPAAGSFEGGLAEIVVEDSSRADAPARFVARTKLSGISHQAGAAERIGFTLDSPETPKGRRYSIRAWLSSPSPGQFTAERIYVPGDGAPVLLPLVAAGSRDE